MGPLLRIRTLLQLRNGLPCTFWTLGDILSFIPVPFLALHLITSYEHCAATRQRNVPYIHPSFSNPWFFVSKFPTYTLH
ncbi:uncharacterized protein BJX67DRAFT_318164 [Aspergillus lucknowensis]|uniref:Uncharacterized protein n=1 Tax=Aspergillus lucknowensis TaxID=176173 RepID=A0ABR4LBX5_9EURO